ncbi:MAG: hypothetical protein JNJ54_05290 [Myxococcaceae bacterium]|nr:hypothetical protein [Myxococcaceae bacterium]
MHRAPWLLLFFAACPPPPPVQPTVTQVQTVDVAGLVVLVGGLPGPTSFGFRVFNPRTGKASAAREVVADGADVVAAGSPDGRSMAWIDGARRLHVARLALDGEGTPVLTELAAPRVTDATRLDFTSHPDRLVTGGDFVVVPDAGVTSCAGVSVSPDGVTWVGRCNDLTTLMRDRAVVMPLASGASFSADGQFLVEGDPLHVFDRTVLADPTRADPRGDGPFSIPDGVPQRDDALELNLVGINGKYVDEEPLIEAFRRSVKESTRVPEPGRRWRLHAVFSSRDVNAFEPTPSTSLDGLPASDGRGWLPLGTLADGSADVWSMIGWNISFEDGVRQVGAWSLLHVRARGDGSVRRHEGRKLLGACRAAPPLSGRYGRAPRGLVLFREDTWGCEAAVRQGDKDSNAFDTSSVVGWRGEQRGQAVEWGDVGSLMTPDGRAFVRSGTADGAGKGLCFTRVEERSTACIDDASLEGFQPRLVIGHAVAPPPGAAAVVTWLSHQGAVAGDEVRVFGARFGSSGTLRLGGLTVPASHLVSWTDDVIVFRVPDDAPRFARVLVDAGQGSDTDARPFFFSRTERWVSPLADVRPSVVTVYQGYTRVPDARPGQRTTLVADERRFVTEPTTGNVNGEFLLRSERACAPRTRLWLRQGAYATHLPVSCPGTLDPSLPWTLVPGPSETADTTRQPRTHHFYEEVILTGAGATGRQDWQALMRVTAAGVWETTPIVGRTPQRADADLIAMPAQGSLATLPDGSVLRLGHPIEEPGLISTQALDLVGGNWVPRNLATVTIPPNFTSVAALSGRVVIAGANFQDNFRPVLRTSTNGTTFPLENLGASNAAGSFAPIFAVPSGRRRGFIGVFREGNVAMPRATDGPRSLYTLALDGTLTEAALPLPPGIANDPQQTDWGVLGPRLFAWNREAGTLHVLDTDAMTPAWAALPFGGRRVTSFVVDETRRRVYVAAQGSLWRSQVDSLVFEERAVTLPTSLGPMTFTWFAEDKAGFAHVGVAEWSGVTSTPPVRATLVGRPVP